MKLILQTENDFDEDEDKVLKETFDCLQNFKKLKLATFNSKILHKEYFLPAGVYEDFELFMKCYNAINNKNGVEDVVELIICSAGNMNYDEMKASIYGWLDFYLKINKKPVTKEQVDYLINELNKKYENVGGKTNR